MFVLEDSPWHRVAHAHGVESGGSQWVRYLQFRDLLRRSAAARRTYEEAKQRLAQQYPDSPRRYTADKDATVQRLLAADAELRLGPQICQVQRVVRWETADETCALARTYRLSPGRKAVNLVMGALLNLGVPAPQKTSYLLTTRGRKSGRERTVPVNLVEADDDRWLVSPYGDVAWVHNLRANGALQLRRGRARESLVAEEVGPEEAGPILQRYIRQVPITAPFFDARRTDPVENFVAEAGRHPVFRLKSASESA